jgi:hypothetical protein
VDVALESFAGVVVYEARSTSEALVYEGDFSTEATLTLESSAWHRCRFSAQRRGRLAIEAKGGDR